MKTKLLNFHCSSPDVLITVMAMEFVNLLVFVNVMQDGLELPVMPNQVRILTNFSF
jgi:hypothetical protein